MGSAPDVFETGNKDGVYAALFRLGGWEGGWKLGDDSVEWED
jgi:hypothetical protein